MTASNSSAPQWLSVLASSSFGGSVATDAYVPQTPENFAYDLDGNILSDGRWNYTWDAENRLIAMETYGHRSGQSTAVWTSGVPQVHIDFFYDYQGRRISKKISNWNGSAFVVSGETRFAYENWNVIAEYSVSGSTLTLTNGYLWGMDISGKRHGAGGVGGLLAMITSTGAVEIPIYDANGNVQGLTDRSSAQLTACYEYSPFGEALRSTGTSAQTNPFRYSSKFADDETHLIYFGHRYYNPSLGRFLGRDEIEEKGGLHLFAYCANNAVNLYDVLGNDPDTAWADFVEGEKSNGLTDEQISELTTSDDMYNDGHDHNPQDTSGEASWAGIPNVMAEEGAYSGGQLSSPIASVTATDYIIQPGQMLGASEGAYSQSVESTEQAVQKGTSTLGPTSVLEYSDPNTAAQVQISVGYTPVVVFGITTGEYHSFVIATDMSTGQSIYSRAGPSANGFFSSSTDAGLSSSGGSISASNGNGSSGGFGFGTVYAQGGVPWNDSSPNDTPSQTVAVYVVGTSTQTLGQVQQSMTTFQNAVNSTNTAYFPLPGLVGGAGLNSNSYAASLQQYLGVSPQPVPSLPTPGSNYFFH
jgi:RHS repeat-associated protein